MRTVSSFLLLGLVIVATSCFSYRELPIEYDYSYYGRFKKYRTFAFMRPPEQDTIIRNEIVEDAISSRLRLQGYKYKTQKPNLLISYRLYYDSLKFRGYDQPEIEEWSKRPRVNEEYNTRTYEMQTGTLLIQIFDRRQERSIWQGYATGMYGDTYLRNSRQLKVAVRSILDRYRFMADGFMEGELSNEVEGLDNP